MQLPHKRTTHEAGGSLPGADVTVVDISGDDDSESAQSRLAMKYDHVIHIRVQPRFYRLAYVTQTLQRRRQCIRPTEVQNLEQLHAVRLTFDNYQNTVQ